MNRTEAEVLWGRLDTLLSNLFETISEIIDTKAWEPLGFSSFTEAWDSTDKRKWSFAQDVKNLVVYHMISEGKSDAEIAELINDYGPPRVGNLRRQRKAGFPPEKANPYADPTKTVKVKPFVRRPPGVTMNIPPVTLSDFDYNRAVTVMEKGNITRKELATRAIISYLDRQGES